MDPFNYPNPLGYFGGVKLVCAICFFPIILNINYDEYS